tara:strand:- start:1485 stop:2561 length:1077 start_codon:yes stop_codon:yes gene_type:complete
MSNINPYINGSPCNQWASWRAQGNANESYQAALRARKNELLEHKNNANKLSKVARYKVALGKKIKIVPSLSNLQVIPIFFSEISEEQRSTYTIPFDKNITNYTVELSNNYISGFKVSATTNCSNFIDISGIKSSFKTGTFIAPESGEFSITNSNFDVVSYPTNIVVSNPTNQFTNTYTINVKSIPPSPYLSNITIVPRVVYKSGIEDASEYIWSSAISLDENALKQFDVSNFNSLDTSYNNQVLNVDVASVYGESGADFARTAAGYQIIATTVDPQTKIDISGGIEHGATDFYFNPENASSLTYDVSSGVAYPPGAGFPPNGVLNTSVGQAITFYDNQITTEASNKNRAVYFVQIKTT